MTPANRLQLIVLAAICGASFLLMRLAVPALGPVWRIEWRVLLAAVGARVTGFDPRALSGARAARHG